MSVAESDVEIAAIEYLEELGWSHIEGPKLAPDGEGPERSNWHSVVLEERLRTALFQINTSLPKEAIEDAMSQIKRLDSPSLSENNEAFHSLLINGIEIQVKSESGTRGDLAWLIDFDDPSRNDWLVVNQLTVIDGNNMRRPDLVLYVNGLPLAVVELKNPTDIGATVETAWNQLQLYKTQIPVLFATNEIMVVSDGTDTRIGSLTAGLDRFGPWRTIDGQTDVPLSMPSIEVLIRSLFEHERLLDYLQNFIICEREDTYIKKIAGYHQFFAVNKALDQTIRASSETGDQRIGVMYHTTGSGKSVSMSLYAGKIIKEAAMKNPTVVVVTDRNDLDGQLFSTFCSAQNLLRQSPQKAESREELRELLSVASGGVVFTTIQKFSLTDSEREYGTGYPSLSTRRNIIVIVDEAHRTQYGFEARFDTNTGQVKYGLARNIRDGLPNASFIGFTGTPIEFEDKSTPAVFGDYIDTYTIQQAVRDGFTVPIHYEARLARVNLSEDVKPVIDEEFEEITEGTEDKVKEKIKSKWARLEALVGTEQRLEVLAKDLLEHWERRLEILDGKAMVVCMSRRICVDLYNIIISHRPEWHSDDDSEGVIKVVMTGSGSDPVEFHPHVRGKARQKVIEKRFKDAEDPLKIVIVRDMWMTGFDVPSAHTMYVDKPMRGHGLLQAIARVNRKFTNKPSGLVVDYIGLGDALQKAVQRYGDNSEERPGLPIEVALSVLTEKAEVIRSIFHGFDYTGYTSPKSSIRLSALTGGVNHVCGLDPGDPENGKKRYLKAVSELNKAAGIALHLEGARHLRNEIGYFQSVARNIKKYTLVGNQSDSEMGAAIQQILSGAIASDGIIDIFGEAGIKRPDISILSDEFLETVQTSEHQNLQLELLRKLINDEIRVLSSKNLIQSSRFSELLERTLLRYQNRTIDAAEIILELVELAKEIRDAPKRGDSLGLSEDEMAFYDALANHGDVKEVMGDSLLASIARDLIESIRKSVSVDWTKKESVRADMRRKIKRLLRKHGYPPDKREEAVFTIIRQAEQVCKDWASSAPAGI